MGTVTPMPKSIKILINNNFMKKVNYYHYTPECRLPEILKSKNILLIKTHIQGKEKPCAWVSTNQVWENTATKMAYSPSDNQLIQLDFEQQLEKFGCARIQVKPTNLLSWEKLKNTGQIDSVVANGYEQAGKKMGGNPNQWYGSLAPIHINDWIKIEVYRNGEWILVQKI